MSGLRIGSLFSGYGGLDTAVQAVLGGTVAWHCENNPAAARLLAHHAPDVPNLGDITAAPWADVEPVDVLTGGFPCQDVSSAGRRAGLTPDSRSGLWTHMARAINVLRPRLVVIENVRGLLSADAACDVEPCPWCLGDDEGRPLRALGAVLGDLAVIGYDAQWCGVRASDAGAPHERFRVIVTAWPAGADAAELGRRPAGRDDGIRAAGLVASPDANADGVGSVRGGRTRRGRPGPADDSVATPDPDGDAVREQPVAERGGRGAAVAGQHGVGSVAADPHRCGDSEESACPDEFAGQRPQVGRRPVELTGAGRGDLAAGGGTAGQSASGRGTAGSNSRHGEEAAADADDHGREGRAERDGGPEAGQQAPLGGDAAGRVLDWGDYGPAVHRWELILGRPAPAPTMTGRRGGQQLAPAFVEWLMGLSAGHVTDVPGLSRNDQLKLLGNGVVPQQAELALRHLLATETPAKRSDVA